VNSSLEKDPTLRDLLRILSRRRRAFWITALSLFLVSVALCIFLTRRYEATGIFQMQESSAADMMDLSDLMGSASSSAGSSLTLTTDLQTFANILESDTLALKVIRDLNLEKNEDFRPKWNPIQPIIKLITPQGEPDRPGTPLEDAPYRREEALKTFYDHLNVKVDAGTRLIEVSYRNPNPKVAAAVVNNLIQGLIDFTFQTKFNATNKAATWLQGQLSDMQKQVLNLQGQVVDLQKKSDIFGTGGSDLQGKPIIFSPALSRLEQSTQVLSEARINRVLKGAIYQIVKTGNAELISQLAGSTMATEPGAGMASSLSLVQNLRGQESQLESQIGQESAIYGASFPKLIEDRNSLKSVQKSLQDEIARMNTRAENDYKIAVQTENGAEAAYNADKAAAAKLNEDAIQFTILSKDADSAETVYQTLLTKLKEAGILDGLQSTNLTDVNIARPSAKPASPNVPLFLALGVLLGIFFGVCAAFLLDAIDNKIQSSDDVENLNVPLLTVVPMMKKTEGQMIELGEKYSAFGEAVRRLRSTLLLSQIAAPPKVVLVTSGNATEGKSTLSLNLAAAFSQLDKKVLLVEADLRRPVLQKRLGLKAKNGLSTLLTDQSAEFAPESLQEFPNLYLLPAGHVPPFPSELLGSGHLAKLLEVWQQQFDFVIIDSPPVLPLSDAQVLAPLADTSVLIARAGVTTRIALQRTYSILIPHLKDPSKPALGVVLNAVSLSSAAYYGYYGYYGDKKYGYEQE
jgi:polysaccharide biosynthesis transport protein